MHVSLTGDSKLTKSLNVACMVVCVCVAQWLNGNLSEVYSASRTVTAGITSQDKQDVAGIVNKWWAIIIIHLHQACLPITRCLHELWTSFLTPCHLWCQDIMSWIWFENVHAPKLSHVPKKKEEEVCKNKTYGRWKKQHGMTTKHNHEGKGFQSWSEGFCCVYEIRLLSLNTT